MIGYHIVWDGYCLSHNLADSEDYDKVGYKTTFIGRANNLPEIWWKTMLLRLATLAAIANQTLRSRCYSVEPAF
jgi:hypothetical protein